MSRTERFLLPCVLALSMAGCAAPTAPEPQPAPSDPASRIAESVLEKMGGREAWEATRYVRWRFFGRRLHFWNRQTGDVRIESPEREREGQPPDPEVLVLFNIDTMQGRAWEAGKEVDDPERRRELLERGHEWWVNDSYWMFMPYKLLDPGTRLRHTGEGRLADGRAADVLDLTFDEGVGYTPENRYEIFVARDTGLVEQWAFYAAADETEPRFTLPWERWDRFGRILLATGHGQGKDWEIAVFDELPRAVFESPDPL